MKASIVIVTAFVASVASAPSLASKADIEKTMSSAIAAQVQVIQTEIVAATKNALDETVESWKQAFVDTDEDMIEVAAVAEANANADID
ncbi:hypothetical protein [Pseudidiomarina taiwanensis]|uniref:Uncharacterized protein n=1 Tax=Pseudidiomarina taiwanensis TaxID=337250 RepID=A0A432ZM97_9GAMM|nr:hypothetical protein [Pseudidiomarina taiwanensis]RUO79009.1 hypothetical protein CWI83_00350 [Pseudidiomarina taiwanensis]